MLQNLNDNENTQSLDLGASKILSVITANAWRKQPVGGLIQMLGINAPTKRLVRKAGFA